MRSFARLGALTLVASAFAVACASETDGGDDSSADALSSLGVFDADLAKNQARKVTTHGKGDFCVAVKRLPGVTYRDDDDKKEDKLCGVDFYTPTSQGDDQHAVAVCPKIISTNPGVSVYEIPDGQAKAALESEASCLNLTALDKLDKVGKYKQSLWCSHTGAILSAYHVSRALGDVAGVPPAVFRTMDKVSHHAIVDLGGSLTRTKYANSPGTFIRRNWNALWPCLHDGRSDCGNPGTPSENLYIRGPVLWDDDVQAAGFKGGHLVGALMGNASEDGTYPGITTQASLKANKRYVATTTAGLTFAKSFAQETVQGILAMKDIGDFLILDTIIEQQDRFSDSGGNLSQKKYLVWEKDGVMQSERADKKKDAPADALTISRMVIEDNDCGLRKGMRKLRGYDDFIAPIRHLAPTTYKGLQDLAKMIDSQHDVFTQAMAMSNSEFARLSENVKFVAGVFADKCTKGQLELDLDVDTYVKGGQVPSCK
jgi:hypothetical protein